MSEPEAPRNRMSAGLPKRRSKLQRVSRAFLSQAAAREESLIAEIESWKRELEGVRMEEEERAQRALARESDHLIEIKYLRETLEAERARFRESTGSLDREKELQQTNAAESAALKRQRGVMNRAAVILDECVTIVCIYAGKMTGHESDWREKQQALKSKAKDNVLLALSQAKEILGMEMKRVSELQVRVDVREQEARDAQKSHDERLKAAEEVKKGLQENLEELNEKCVKMQTTFALERNELKAQISAEKEACAVAEESQQIALKERSLHAIALSEKEEVIKAQLARILEYVQMRETWSKELKNTQERARADQIVAMQERKEKDRLSKEASQFRADAFKFKEALKASKSQLSSLLRQLRSMQDREKLRERQESLNRRPRTAPAEYRVSSCKSPGRKAAAGRIPARPQGTSAAARKYGGAPVRRKMEEKDW